MTVSLNPYCSGRWSRTQHGFNIADFLYCVLILIVVEDGLVLDANGNILKSDTQS